MNACDVDPKCTLYLHMTWIAEDFRSFAWRYSEDSGILLSDSDPLAPTVMKREVEGSREAEHIVLHVEGDEGGEGASEILFKDAIHLAALLGENAVDFDQLAAEGESSAHLIQPPGVRSGQPIPARELWTVPAGERHPVLTTMRSMQANGRRKASHQEDVQRMVTLHIEKRRTLGCDSVQDMSGRPAARRGVRRVGRVGPNR